MTPLHSADDGDRSILGSFDPNTRRIMHQAVALGIPLLRAIHIFFDAYDTLIPTLENVDITAAKLRVIYDCEQLSERMGNPRRESDVPTDTVIIKAKKVK